MKKKIFFILVLALISVTTTKAKDIYVRAGSNGMGTKDAPWGTISDALQFVYAGDVIHVAQGVYYGAGGGGLWIIDKPDITLVGGYNNDFSERNPFKYRTILMRGVEADASLDECQKRGHDKWHSLKQIKASYNGKAMVQGDRGAVNFVLDGFYIDGHTRNAYKENGDLRTDVGPITSPLVEVNAEGAKIRNCVILNSGGPAVSLRGYGLKGKPETWPEVTNCFLLNTLMEAIDLRVGNYDPTNQPDGGYALVQNNTIAFVWEHLGEGYGLLVGRQTKLRVMNNLFVFSSHVAINNGFQNKYLRLIDNLFWNNMGGTYQYWDPQSSLTLIEDDGSKLGSSDPSQAKILSRKYSISKKSKGNIMEDPKITGIDKQFFEKFSNQIKSTGGGKVEWNSVNQWRSMMGLPLIGSQGTGKKNYAPIYEIDFALIKPQNSQYSKYGANVNGPFQEYHSTSVAPADKNYTAISPNDLCGAKSMSLDKKDVTFVTKIGMKKPASNYYRKDKAPVSKYACYEIGMYPNNTFIYIPYGSPALETIEEAVSNKLEVTISGTAYSIKDTYKADKLCVIVDDAEIEEED